jgi:hypothetical protein
VCSDWKTPLCISDKDDKEATCREMNTIFEELLTKLDAEGKTLHRNLSIPFMYNDPKDKDQNESLNN